LTPLRKTPAVDTENRNAKAFREGSRGVNIFSKKELRRKKGQIKRKGKETSLKVFLAGNWQNAKNPPALEKEGTLGPTHRQEGTKTPTAPEHFPR